MANLPVSLVCQHSGADPSTGLFEVSDILQLQSWQQDPIALHKLVEGVANWVPGSANPARERERERER